MTDSLVCMCACVRHGIHAHSVIESIPDSIRFLLWIVCILYSGYGKLNSRATQRVLNEKLIYKSKDSCTLSTVGAAKPRATRQVQHVLCHAVDLVGAAKPRATQQVQHVLCHAVDLVGAAKPRAALRPLNKN